MPVITIFSGIFCGADAVIRHVGAATGRRLIDDKTIIQMAAEISGVPANRIRRTLAAKTSVFNAFTHEKGGSIAALRLALATTLKNGPAIVHGFSSLLIPERLNHGLRVCLIADLPYRIRQADIRQHLSEKEALESIRQRDGQSAAWTEHLFAIRNPWDSRLYDLVLPMNQMEAREAGSRIEGLLSDPAAGGGCVSNPALKDFLLAASVEMAIFKAGHEASVSVDNGTATLTVDKCPPIPTHLEAQLKSIAEAVPGVGSVAQRMEGDGDANRMYHQYRADVPSRVLLVDDEREFVLTLSERLQLRNMGSAVVHDGESALTLIDEDEPEVIVLDLKMPGIDGLEVLKRVKATRPAIEVIVLTGHGSETDRRQCMALGAYAYMQKPVDIDDLSENLKNAHEKIRKFNA
jgi:two-component system response regulator CpxR